MRTFYTRLLVFVLCLGMASQMKAQIALGETFLKGIYTMVGVTACASYGTVNPPIPPTCPTCVGYYYNAAGGLGFVSDAGRNGWLVAGAGALPNYCGDYFLPGTPVEGWAMQVGLVGVAGTSYYYGANTGSRCGTITGAYAGSTVNGVMSGYLPGPSPVQGIWTSSPIIATGAGAGINMRQRTYFPDTANWFVTEIRLTNTTTSDKYNIFYQRGLDPDNDVQWPGGSFTTTNLIVSQPDSTTCDALVQAVGPLGCYLGIGARNQDARVAMGGFFVQDFAPEQVWNGTGGTAFPSLISAVGGTRVADEGTRLAMKIDTLPAGTYKQFAFAYVLDQSQMNSALTQTSVYNMYANGALLTGDSLFFTQCNDTATTLLNIAGANANEFIWTWGPASILDTTSGLTVRASPRVTSWVYAIGDGACASDTLWLQIFVDTLLQDLHAALPDDTNICLGGSVLMESDTAADNWLWAPNLYLGGPDTNSSVIASPIQDMNYSLRIMDIYGCFRYDTVRLTVDSFQVHAGGDDTTCNGNTVAIGVPVPLTGNNPLSILGATYSWSSDPPAGTAWFGSTTVPNTTWTPPFGTYGNYNLILTATVQGGACSYSDTAVIFVDSSGVVSITNLDSIYCVRDAAIVLTASPTGGTFGGFGVSGGIFTPSSAGVGGPRPVSYTFTYPISGCVVTVWDSTYVDALPVMGMSGLGSSYCIYDPVVSLTGTPSGGFFFGTGMIGSNFNPAIAGPGTHSIGYYYVNPISGCDDTIIRTTTVNDRPIVSFSGLDSVYCVTDANDPLTGIPAGGTFSGLGIAGTNFSPVLAGAGTKTIYYNYADPLTGCVNSDTQTTLVNAVPIIRLTLDSIYCRNEGIVTGIPSMPGGVFGGAGVVDTILGTYDIGVPLGTGPHVATYDVYDPATTCPISVTETYYIGNLVTASISGLAPEYCVSSSAAALTGNPAGGLFFGPGIVGSSFNPAVAGAGTHTIYYSYTNPFSFCSDTASATTIVNPLPVVSFSGLATDYCIDDTVASLTGIPSGGVFSGPGIAGATFNPSAATVGGPYNITYTYTDTNSCTNTNVQPVTVHALPTIAIVGMPTTICIDAVPLDLTTYASPAGGTWAGTGVVGSDFDPVVAGVGGPYTLTYTYTDGFSCTNSRTTTISVIALPNPDFVGLDSQYCVNALSSLLTGIPGGGVFSGPGIAGTTFNPSTAGVGGPYTVTYTYTDGSGCTNTKQYNTYVAGLPAANAGPDDTVCNGNSTTLLASGGVAYVWSNGTFGAPNTVAPATQTTYSVTVTDANGCSASDATTVYIRTLSISFINVPPSCYGFSDGQIIAVPTGGQTPYTYVWSDITAQTSNPAINLSSGAYTVSITDVNGCTVENTSVLTQPNLLTFTESIDDVKCYGASDGIVTMSGNGGTPAYNFSVATLDSSQVWAGNPMYGVPAGTYLGVVVDANGCLSSHTVTVGSPPELDGTATTVDPNCYGYADGFIQITALGGTPPYQYDLNGSLNTHGYFNHIAAGVYSLYVRDANGCIDTVTTTVGQPDPIIVDISPDTLFLPLGESGQFIATYTGVQGSPVELVWSPGVGVSCPDCPNPILTPYDDGEYVLTVIDHSQPLANPPCSGTGIGYVFVEDGLPTYVPNAFSPNGDGINEQFKVYGEDLKNVRMLIFDRYGEKLFESVNEAYGWDGTYMGKLLQPGVYVYYVEAEYLNGEKFEKRGSVTLVR